MSRRPNLLYLLTDQQRTDTLACYGNGRIGTSNLDALAAESFVFDRAYVSQPVCSPSRATLMTGLWPHTAGVPACNVPLPATAPTFAEHLGDDYATAYMGKWHLGDEIFAQHGFDTWVGTESSYRHSYSDPARLGTLSPYQTWLMERGFEPDREHGGQRIFSRHAEASMEERFTKAAYLGERAAEYVGAHRDEPFALCVSYLEPHPPHTGPLNDLHDPAALPTGPGFRRPPEADAPLILRLMAAYYLASEEYGFDLQTEAGWRGVMARYWGNVNLVDRSVGRILRALEDNGLADDTIVVFTSDHGEQMGDHGLLGKTVMYEESVRVPMLLRAPRLGRRQRRLAGYLSQVDLVPTLLELLGEDLPVSLQGTSRVAALEAGVLEGEDVFIEWNGADGHPPASLGEAEVNRSMAQPSRSVVSEDRWKLNLYTSGPGELYDLSADPHELSNLFHRAEHRGRIDDLASRIRRWQADTGDTALIAA